MASRDEILKFIVKASGEKNLEAISRALDDLGDAAQDVQKRADGLLKDFADATTAQRAVAQFKETGRSVLELARKVEEAKTKVAALGKELSATDEPTKKQVAAFDAARAALARLEAAEDKQRAKLGELRQAIQSQGLETNNLVKAEATLAARRQQSVVALQAEVSAFRTARAEASRLAAAQREEEQAALRTVRANTSAAEALRKYRDGARDASAGNDQLAQSSGRLSGVFSSVKGALAGVVGFLSFRSAVDGVKNLLQLGDAVERTKIRLAQLFGSTAAGNEAFEKIRAIATANGQAFDATLKAATKLKSFGLDPLKGSLQAVIDQNAALGGSEENLEGIVLALGQAWAKQKLQGEEILQLVERGVPVWDLLAKATGKNTIELQKLSEQGKLGRDVIAQLIGQIGKASEGAAAKNLGTLSGLFTQLKDKASQFFQSVADSGALDFFKDKLSEVLKKIQELRDNGQLQKYAQQLSDAIVSASKSVIGGIQFIAEHTRAILALGAAYAAFRIGSFVTTIASATQALIATGTAASGAVGSVSLFSRAIAAISANPAILAIGAAAAFTGTQLINLAEALKENAAAQQLLEDVEADAINSKAQLKSRIESLIESNKQYADTQIKAALEVQALGGVEAKAYQQRLERAREFYAAIALQAKLAGDQVGLQGAKDKLAEVQAALAQVTKRLEDIEDAATKAVGKFSEFATTAATKFDELAQKGDGAHKAVQDLFKDLDITTPKGLTEAGQVLQNIAARGKEAGQAIRVELREQILKLSDQDFAKFQQSAQKAFSSGKAGADTLKEALSGINLARLGVDIEAIKSGFTKAGGAAVEAFRGASKEIETAGLTAEQQSQAMVASFEAALAKASTSKELEALKDALGDAFDKGKIGAKEYAKEIEDVKAKLAKLTSDENLFKPSIDGFQQVADAARDAGNAAKDAGDQAQEGTKEISGAAAALSGAIQANREEFLKLGENAAKAFDDILFGLSKTQVAFGTQHAAGELLQTISDAAARTQQLIDQQRQSLVALTQSLATYGEEGASAFRVTADGAASALAGLDSLQEGIKQGTAGFELLGQQELAPLQAAIDGARQRLQRLEEEAKAAEESLSNLGSSLQDQIDQLKGDQTAIENRRFEEQLRQIDELAKKSGAAGAEAAARDRAAANELHQLKLKQIEDEQAARNKGGGGGGGNGPPDPAPTGGGGGGRGGGRGGGGNSGSSGGINIHVAGSILGSNPQDLAEELARLVGPQLDAIHRRSK